MESRGASSARLATPHSTCSTATGRTGGSRIGMATVPRVDTPHRASRGARTRTRTRYGSCTSARCGCPCCPPPARRTR